MILILFYLSVYNVREKGNYALTIMLMLKSINNFCLILFIFNLVIDNISLIKMQSR